MAVDCSQQLEQDRLQCLNRQEKWAVLQGCHEKLSQFSPELFQETKSQACSLQNPWGRKLWNMTWLRCQEVSQQLEDTLQDLEQDQHPSVPGTLQGEWHGNAGQDHTDGGPILLQLDTHQNPHECPEVKVRQKRDSIHGTVSCFNISFRQSRKGRKGTKMAPVADPDEKSPRKTDHDHRQTPVARSENSSSASSSHISRPTCSATQTSVLQNPIPLSDSLCSETLGCESRQLENTCYSEETTSWGNEAANTRSTPGMDSNTV